MCQLVPAVRRATFVLSCEANLGTIASDVKRLLDQRARHQPLMPRYVVMEEDRRRSRHGGAIGEPTITPGLRIDNKLKVRGVEIVDEMLRYNVLLFARPFIVSPMAGSDESSEKASSRVRDAIVRQLLSYKRRITYNQAASRNVWRPVRPTIVFSGKDGVSQRDDWVSALTELPLVIDIFWRTDKYMYNRASV